MGDGGDVIVDVVIPARNEEESLPLVLGADPEGRGAHGLRRRQRLDRRHGQGGGAGRAQLLSEPTPGYGAALLRGVNELQALPRPPDVVVFLDGDYADEPSELPWLLEPIRAGSADLVIGSRALGQAEPGALAVQQRVGNRVATTMIRAIYGQRYTDLGPFRAIRLPALVALGMSDAGHGWTIEMQVKAARGGLRIAEVPVSYRRRGGWAQQDLADHQGERGVVVQDHLHDLATRDRALKAEDDVDDRDLRARAGAGRGQDAAGQDGRRRAGAGAVRGVPRRHLRADAGARRAAGARRSPATSTIRAWRTCASRSGSPSSRRATAISARAWRGPSRRTWRRGRW